MEPIRKIARAADFDNMAALNRTAGNQSSRKSATYLARARWLSSEKPRS